MKLPGLRDKLEEWRRDGGGMGEGQRREGMAEAHAWWWVWKEGAPITCLLFARLLLCSLPLGTHFLLVLALAEGRRAGGVTFSFR